MGCLKRQKIIIIIIISEITEKKNNKLKYFTKWFIWKTTCLNFELDKHYPKNNK